MGSLLRGDERVFLLEEHAIERERRYADRIKTLLLFDDGMSPEEISRVLFLDETTLNGILSRYEYFKIRKALWAYSLSGGEYMYCPLYVPS